MFNLVKILSYLAGSAGVFLLIFATFVALVVRVRRISTRGGIIGTTANGRKISVKTSARRVLLVAVLLIPFFVITVMLPKDSLSDVSNEELPNASSGVIVIDVSGSISKQQSTEIQKLFQQAVDMKLNVGLIIFADEAYMLWGPNVPAEQGLKNILRFFDANGKAMKMNNSRPWRVGYGTEAVTGLHDAIRAKEMMDELGFTDTPIILVSDLHDASKEKDMNSALSYIRANNIDIRIIDLTELLNPNGTRVGSDRQMFEDFLGKDVFISDFSSLEPVGSGGESPVSSSDGIELYVWALPVLVLVLFVVANVVFPELPIKKERKEEGSE